MISDLKLFLFSLTIENKLKNITIQLESQNNLMTFETEILCDRVKSINECFEEMLNSVKKIQTLESFVLANGRLGANVSEMFLELETKMKKVTESRDSILSDYKEFLNTKEENTKSHNKMIRVFKERFNSLQNEYAIILQEREALKSRNLELEKMHSDVSEELQKLRKKVKSRIANGSNIDQEKFCSKCQKTYFERENYNWSCKTHHGNMHENVYWCCGKNGEESGGCVIGKHISKEEAITQIHDPYAVKFCIGCKKHGHLLVDCPKDPNYKTHVEIQEEFKRVERLAAPKRRISVVNSNQNEDGILMNIAQKMFGSDFAKEKDTDEEEEEVEGLFFRDLLEIKQELDFEERLLWLKNNIDEHPVEIDSSNKEYRKRRTALLIKKTFGSS